MKPWVMGFLNGGMVGALAGAAGFPWWACPIFAGLSCFFVAWGVQN